MGERAAFISALQLKSDGCGADVGSGLEPTGLRLIFIQPDVDGSAAPD